MANLAASGDTTPSVVGKTITSPWVPDHPDVVITQQYGGTDFTGEPAGHGVAHWHAGVDLGYPANTIVQFPQVDGGTAQEILAALVGIAGLGAAQAALAGATNSVFVGRMHHGSWNGSAYVPDPGGYGDHVATITVSLGGRDLYDVLLGHGSGWLTGDGQPVRPGDNLIKVDCEGNCTGPHLHFEVRPPRGRYGSDVDPWPVVTNGAGQALANVAGDIGAEVTQAAQLVSGAITGAEQRVSDLVIGTGLAGLGVAMIGAGIWIGVRGLQGLGAAAASSATRRRPPTPRRAQLPARRPVQVLRPRSRTPGPRPPQPAQPAVRGG